MKIREVLLIYKKRPLLRLALIALVIATCYVVFGQTASDLFVIAVIVSVLEFLTINVIFERDFYPVSAFAETYFPDRRSFGNKALYWVFYVAYVVLGLLAMIIWM